MAVPGEVNQTIGRAYQLAFIAALEAHLKGFENRFSVDTEPDKTSFIDRSGNSFSFDFSGVFRDYIRSCEVFGESKGYLRAGNLKSEYELFVARAYVTMADYTRNRHDLFWFVTNVPFACQIGSDITSVGFLKRILTGDSGKGVREILGNGHIDDSLIAELANNLGVFILTNSYLLKAELSYRVAPGDTIWAILKRFRAGTAPPGFADIATQIASENGLESPDRVRSGSRIRFRWHGIVGGDLSASNELTDPGANSLGEGQ